MRSPRAMLAAVARWPRAAPSPAGEAPFVGRGGVSGHLRVPLPSLPRRSPVPWASVAGCGAGWQCAGWFSSLSPPGWAQLPVCRLRSGRGRAPPRVL